MSVPEWASPDLSESLPSLRSRGEGQSLEFMEVFPEQAHELAKEIAAFATSNPGTILLGIADSGDLLGIVDAGTPLGRDKLLRRIEGISNKVKPPVTPIVEFAVERGKVVVAIKIAKGMQSVYFSNDKPYVRHLSESRPADPVEVLEVIERWTDSRGAAPSALRQRGFLLRVAPVLDDLVILASEIDDRIMAPWLQMARRRFAEFARELRELSADESANTQQAAELLAIADDITVAARTQIRVADSNTLFRAVRAAGEKATAFKSLNVRFAQRPIELSIDELKCCASDLQGIRRQADAVIVLEQVHTVTLLVSKIGLRLRRVAQVDLDRASEGLTAGVEQIGRRLHVAETARLDQLDDRSIRGVLRLVATTTQELESLVARLPRTAAN